VTKKRRRKPSSGTGRGETPTPPDAPAEAAAIDEEESTQSEERPQRGWGAVRPSPYPPLGVSLIHGLRTVGGSPLILGCVFLASLVAWMGLVLIRAEPAPNVMANQLVLWPLQATGFPPGIVLPDLFFVFSALPEPLGALPLLIASAVVRSSILGTLLILIDQDLREGRPALATVGRRLPSVGTTLFAVYVIEVTVVYLAFLVVFPFLGAQFGVILSLAAFYFLVMVPVVVAAEGARARDAFGRAFRAARLPGTRHLSLTLVYVLFLFAITSLTARAVLAPATPSFFTWLFVLMAGFLQVGVLAAFHYRWLAVRDQMPAPEPAQRRPARRPSAGRGRRP
jgi:hypothetical protein